MTRALCACVLLAAWWLPARAAASTIVGAAETRDASLKVNANGVALVEFEQRGGRERHVLAWGAINGFANPTDSPAGQRAFRLDYSGGWKSRHDPGYWRRFKDDCRAYDGPPLPLLV